MNTFRKAIKLALILLVPMIGFSQKYDTILLDLDHTVNLVFEDAILDFDIGSGVQVVNGQEVTGILAQKSGSRLKLGAGAENFVRTNIFVETQAAYFNFVVRYGKPDRFACYIQNSAAEKIKSNKQENSPMGAGKAGKKISKAAPEKPGSIIEKIIHDNLSAKSQISTDHKRLPRV